MPELQINLALRTAIAQATGDLFGGGAFQVRAGARPGANEAAAGTLLAEIDPLPDPSFGTASAGAVSRVGTWEATVAATGAPGHFRLISSDETLIREGDAAETPGSGESCILDGLVDGDLIEGGTLTVTYTITQAEGSGDPA